MKAAAPAIIVLGVALLDRAADPDPATAPSLPDPGAVR